MVNPALAVEAVGFRPWNGHWLGIVITPWFMNLVLMPRVAAQWQAIGERESRYYVFPAGVFEFIGARDATLGDYQACSLFSPMFEFADPTAARDTAVAAMGALFDSATREAGTVPLTQGAGAPMGDRAAAEVAGAMVADSATASAVAAAANPPPAARAVSKRDFLFGLPPRADRGP